MKVFTLAFLLSAAAAAERLPMQSDFDRCTLSAEDRGGVIQGRVRLEVLVEKTGRVYASFVHSAEGIEHPQFFRCVANAPMTWALPAVAVDYERPYVVSFVRAGTDIGLSDLHYHQGDWFDGAGRTSSFLPDPNDPAPVVEPNLALAAQTLEIADWATPAEQGTAYLAVRDAAKAIGAFRSALERDASDAMALRGLAHALVLRGGDLTEARSAAQRLVGLDPDGVSGHEALLDVCLAAHDDTCALAQFRAAKEAKDMQTRSRILAGMQDRVFAVAKKIASSNANDPCAEVAGGEAQALCVAKRCLDEGSAEFARELSAQNHEQVAAGEWHSTQVGENRYVVRRSIDEGRHDALWLVTVGDELTMRPASSEARQITLRHNRCLARTLGSR